MLDLRVCTNRKMGLMVFIHICCNVFQLLHVKISTGFSKHDVLFYISQSVVIKVS